MLRTAAIATAPSPVLSGAAGLCLADLSPRPPTPPAEGESSSLHAQLLHHIHQCQRGRGAVLDLVLTDNRSTMILVRRSPGRYRLRLHRMFLAAQGAVLMSLARYVTENDAAASADLNAFIDAQHRQQALRVEDPCGEHHHLLQLFDGLNSRYFADTIQARITWGRRRTSGPPRRHRSVKMGSYDVEDRLIRIHPLLDRPFVPRYFVEWIIYHEMLHQKHPISMVAGRRCFHPPAFVADERKFEDFDRAQSWELRNAHHLLLF